jgi:hypothetical protein
MCLVEWAFIITSVLVEHQNPYCFISAFFREDSINQSVVQKFETYILHNQLISSWPITCLCQACNFKILVSNWRVWQRHLDHRLRTQCLKYSLRWRGYLWWRDNKSLILTSCGPTDGVGLLCSTLKQFADWELPPKVRLASFLHSSFSWNQLSKD